MNFSFFNLGGKKEINLAAAAPEKEVVNYELPTKKELWAMCAEAVRLETHGQSAAAEVLYREIEAAELQFLAMQGELSPGNNTPPAAQDAIGVEKQ